MWNYEPPIDFTIQAFDSLSPTAQLEVAQSVSDYTHTQNEKEKIVPITPQAIFGKQLAHVALDEEVLAGYIGATNPIEHDGFNMSQVGTLCVWPKYRGSGVGQRLVDSLAWTLMSRGQLSYAFCNPYSLNIFKRAHYVEAKPGELPTRASSPYGNQAMVHNHAPRRALRNVPLR